MLPSRHVLRFWNTQAPASLGGLNLNSARAAVFSRMFSLSFMFLHISIPICGQREGAEPIRCRCLLRANSVLGSSFLEHMPPAQRPLSRASIVCFRQTLRLWHFKL
jgi:hypothetical protein